MREIKITVNPDGTTQTDFSGFVGSSCLAEANKLRAALEAFGIKSEQTGFTPKPELDIPITTTQQQSTETNQEAR